MTSYLFSFLLLNWFFLGGGRRWKMILLCEICYIPCQIYADGWEGEHIVCVYSQFAAKNKSLKVSIIKNPRLKPCDFGVIFVLFIIKTHQSPNERSLWWRNRVKEKRGRKSSSLCLCSPCSSPLHGLRKCVFPGSPNMVKHQWGVQQMSHQTPTLPILACVQDREGEKADRET